MTLALMLIIDRIGYGVWTFVPWNFIKFNVLEGKDRLYGVHPWNWYFFQGYPAILGTFMPLTVVGYVTAPVCCSVIMRLLERLTKSLCLSDPSVNSVD